MATYTTNFVAADHTPANWTQRLNSTTYTLVVDAGYTGGGYLRRDAAVQVDPWYLYSWDTVGSVADVDAKLYSQQLVSRGDDDWKWGIGVRASGSGSTPTMYVLGFSGSASSSIEIGKVVSGTYTKLAEKVVNWTFGSANLYWIRTYCVGSTLRMKFWQGVEGDEPAAWDLDITDTSITAAGWFGLANQIRTYQHRFDRLVVDDAPVQGDEQTAPLQDIDWSHYRQVWWNESAPKPRAEFGATATPCADLNTRPASLGGSQFPSGMVYVGDQDTDPYPSAWEQDVQISVLFDGTRPHSAWWNAFREAEFSWAGVAALASGVRNESEASAYGVFAAIQGGTIWPYAPPTDPCVSPKGWYTTANLEIWIIYNGIRIWSDSIAIGSEVIKAWDWLCDRCELPWITVRVKVTRPTDAENKKLKIQAGYVAAADDVSTFQFDSGDLDTRTMWPGGFVLPCGWGGWGWYKPNVHYVGGTGDFAWAAYKNLAITNLSETNCDETPLDECPPGTPGCDPLPVEQPLPEELPTTPCPGIEAGAELGLFVGQGGGNIVFRYGLSEVDFDGPVLAKLRPNVVALAGYDGECWYKNLYVVLTGSGDAVLQVTPVVDGERVVDAQVNYLFTGPGAGQDPITKRFEVALNRPFRDSAGIEQLTYGLRGTTFTVEIELHDVCGTGVAVDGVELDYEVVRESQPEVVYSEELLDEITRIGIGGLYVGQAGSAFLLHADDTTTKDASKNVPVAARTVVVAPDGYGGECVFNNAYVVVTRSQGAVTAKFTPIVDGVELESIFIDYTDVDRVVTEATEIPLSQPFDQTGEKFRYGARGVTMALRFELPTGLPDGIFVIEGAVLDYEAVQESEEHA